MPKRVGYLCEKVLTEENCIRAVLIGTKNLKRTKQIVWIRKHPEKMGRRILAILSEGWVPERTKTKTINEGSAHKVRVLLIPSTRDHLVHTAIMLPLMEIIEKRLDYYCAGSVPERGQKRIHHCLKSWMNEENPVKYAGETDVRHAYKSTTKEVALAAVARLVKDKRYLEWIGMILDQMGEGLAIGFQPSHWLFNLVMDDVDKAVRAECHGVKYCRFMDNIWIGGNRKRQLRRAMDVIRRECAKKGLELNRSTQIFPTEKRAIQALSYRYFRGYTILKKATMYRIAAGMKRAGRNMCAHNCRGALSQIGIVRHCNSYHFRQRRVYRVVNIKRMKEAISSADKKRNLRKRAGGGERAADRKDIAGCCSAAG